jgi:hypothetical protein
MSQVTNFYVANPALKAILPPEDWSQDDDLSDSEEDGEEEGDTARRCLQYGRLRLDTVTEEEEVEENFNEESESIYSEIASK